MFTDDDRELLDSPAFAKLATLMPDGSPQNTVMWFRRDGNTLRMIAPAASQKAQNLVRDPRVAVVIDALHNGYRYIDIRGSAEVRHDDTAARNELRQIVARYIDERADKYVESLSADPRVLIVIHPGRLRSHHGAPPGTS
jgi:PPOX class probable F420-dependent enzyme